MQAKILVIERAVRCDFGADGQLQDDQHEKEAADAHLDRRRSERDDDTADGWNHQVGQETEAAEKYLDLDLDLLDTGAEQDERGEDLVCSLWSDVLNRQAGNSLPESHLYGG
jgi:hypothetical protein